MIKTETYLYLSPLEVLLGGGVVEIAVSSFLKKNEVKYDDFPEMI